MTPLEAIEVLQSECGTAELDISNDGYAGDAQDKFIDACKVAIEILRERENNNQKGESIMNNQKVIVRCDRSGVFYGEIKERNGSEVVMTNARCLWYWYGAASLLQLALEGVTNPKECKFTVYVPEIALLDAIEIIPCSDKAIESIEGVKEWKR